MTNPIKIEFEGTDGAGKTTGIRYFVDTARDQGLTVIETREVGNPHVPATMYLREIALDPGSNLSGESMEMIFAAMRYANDSHFKTLNFADMVVSDRGFFSHLAYGDWNCSVEFTEKFFEGFVGKTTKLPDVVIYFDVSSDVALKRRTSRGTHDIIELKGSEFQDKVRSSFTKYLEKYPGITVFRVDANQDKDSVKAQLLGFLNIIVAHIK